MLFSIGKLVATPGAMSMMQEQGIDASQLIRRHVKGDWGNLDREDIKANKDALVSGARIFSVYEFDHAKLYVITEAKDDNEVRQSTCILLPSEY